MTEADRVRPRGALFVVQTKTRHDPAPVPIWIVAAGWAAAARRLIGASWILSSEGRFSAEDALMRAAGPRPAAHRRRGAIRRALPEPAITAVKDLRTARDAKRRSRQPHDGPWDAHDIAFVWQQHQLFHETGARIADRLRAPLVEMVDAPQVWEARRWGVRRPGYGKAIERYGERPQLRRADVVACVSDEVAEAVLALGVDPARIVVTPNGVDVDAFTPARDGRAVRARHGLDGAFVVGWIGSFRPFHRADMLLELVAGLQDEIANCALMLIGDGQQRQAIEAAARRMGVRRVVFPGAVPYPEVPDYVAAMDVALLPAEAGQRFHYSPLKLREYMAAGRPVVAARVGEVARSVRDGVDGLLVEPGDRAALASAIRALAADADLRRRLGDAARATAIREWSWDKQVLTVLGRLEERIGAAS